MKNSEFDWAVVGAGPAGIAAVGKILDQGVDPKSILWIDPQFQVGDLGRFWSNVSSNTSVKLFLDFLKSRDSFEYDLSSDQFTINQLPHEKTCLLNHIVEPLQWVTNHLKNKVNAIKATVNQLNLHQRVWSLETNSGDFCSKNVILTTGSVPSSLDYPGVDVIPFDTAIDKNLLRQTINPEHTYGVFGSSHSAIIIIRYLCELKVKKIINFYRSPCRYAIKFDDWILFDNTGLKGDTAQWARDNIDGVLPKNLERYNINEQSISSHLPACDKVIYAVGFTKRNNLVINNYEKIAHNPHVGIIGPGLFGLGIAYPEHKTDPFGSPEVQVGLWKFMTYLEKVFPVWMRYHT